MTPETLLQWSSPSSVVSAQCLVGMQKALHAAPVAASLWVEALFACMCLLDDAIAALLPFRH